MQTSVSTSGKSKAAQVRQRVAIGTILILVTFGLFMADASLSRLAPRAGAAAGWIDWTGLALRGGLLSLLAAVLVTAATAETITMCRGAGMRPAAGWALLMGCLLTIHPWLARNVQGLTGDRLLVWLLVVALVGSVAAIMARRQTDGAIQDIASTWFSSVYLGFLASFLVRIRQDVAGPGGAWLLIGLVFVIKSTDIFAYLTGMAVGRHKLIPWLSPGKTIEGLAGGLVGTAIISVLLMRASVIIRTDVIQHPIEPAAYVWAGLIGALLGGIGQIGDLMESLLKRGAKQKDSATLLPGFGGVFDLLDSLLLPAPIAWVVLCRLW